MGQGPGVLPAGGGQGPGDGRRYREAVGYFEQALRPSRICQRRRDTREQAIDLRLDLRGALYPLGEFAKMLTYLQEAEAMARPSLTPAGSGWSPLHTAEHFRQTGRFAEAPALAEQALAMGDRLQDPHLQLYANHYLGLACNALGDYQRASEVLRTVVQSPPIEGRNDAFGGMVIVSWAAFQAITLAWLARGLAELGEFEEGVEAGRQAVALGRRARQPLQPGRSLHRPGVCLPRQGGPRRCRPCA